MKATQAQNIIAEAMERELSKPLTDRVLKVGDRVRIKSRIAGFFGYVPSGPTSYEATITNIEIGCEHDSGTPVNAVDLNALDDSVMVDLDCGKWAYGSQVELL